MSSLTAALLARNSVTIQTRQALIITGLQNDFVSPNGQLPLGTQSDFIERIRELVPAFREHGIIIWVWTEYREARTVNDPSGYGCRVLIPEPETASPSVPGSSREGRPPGFRRSASKIKERHDAMVARAMREDAGLDSMEVDEPPVATVLDDPELFLSATSTRPACCLPGTWGAEPIPEIRDLIKPNDIQITKSYYSAFAETNLLDQLRGKLVTALYFAGCNTNVSIYATATDVARHGLDINLVKDCLGCRDPERHDEAIKQMVSYMGAETITLSSVIARLKGEDELLEDESDYSNDESDEEDSLEPSSPMMWVTQSLSSLQLSKETELNGMVSLIASDNRAVVDTSVAEHAGPSGHEYKIEHESDAESGMGSELKTATAVGELGKQGIDKNQNVDSVNEAGVASEVSALVSGASHGPRDAGPMTDVDQSELPSLSSKVSSPTTSNISSPNQVKMSDLLRGSMSSLQIAASSQAIEVDIPHNDDGFTYVGSNDSYIVKELLPHNLSSIAFQQLLEEVNWQTMFHATGEVPRLLCVQADIDPEHGHMPTYRHPSDHVLPVHSWTDTVKTIKNRVEQVMQGPVNHVLIQLYRDGHDHITEHSDKTLDMKIESSVVNVSFGAQRTMRLRTKRGTREEPRVTQRIPMPNNSMFVLGPKTNKDWLHGIMPDKRATADREQPELAYNSMRISLTFRNIQTFVTHDSRLIWGVGATAKHFKDARKTINGDGEDSAILLKAFSTENRTTSEHFDRRSIYGNGSDVLSLKQITPFPGRENATLFLAKAGNDIYAEKAIKLALALYRKPYTIVAPPLVPTTTPWLDANGDPLPLAPVLRRITFRDVDNFHTITKGVANILVYVERARFCIQQQFSDTESSFRYLNGEMVKQARLMELYRLEELVRSDEIRDYVMDNREACQIPLTLLEETFKHCQDRGAAEAAKHGNTTTEYWRYLSGDSFGIVDCAFYDVVRDLRRRLMTREEMKEWFPVLARWLPRAQRQVRRLRGLGRVRT